MGLYGTLWGSMGLYGGSKPCMLESFCLYASCFVQQVEVEVVVVVVVVVAVVVVEQLLPLLFLL